MVLTQLCSGWKLSRRNIMENMLSGGAVAAVVGILKYQRKGVFISWKREDLPD